LNDVDIRYADYAHWQRQWLQGQVLQSELAYWKQQLIGASFKLTLPTDYPRPPVKGSAGAKHPFRLTLDLSEELKSLSRAEGATVFMTLLAGFNVLLSYYSGQEDIIVGTNVANRDRVEIESLIGLFVNQIVLRTNLSGDPDFRELLARVREKTLGAYSHQELPFDKVVTMMQPERDPSRSPLFQAKFELEVRKPSNQRLTGLDVSVLEPAGSVARYDVHLDMIDSQEGLVGSFIYDANLFKAETIARMSENYKVLLSNIAGNPDSTLSMLSDVLAREDHAIQSLKEQEYEESIKHRFMNVKRRDQELYLNPAAESL
jgi:non-ribosomal peptide synthetase component F